MSDEREDTAESVTDRSTAKDVAKEPSKQFLDPDKVNVPYECGQCSCVPLLLPLTG